MKVLCYLTPLDFLTYFLPSDKTKKCTKKIGRMHRLIFEERLIKNIHAVASSLEAFGMYYLK